MAYEQLSGVTLSPFFRGRLLMEQLLFILFRCTKPPNRLPGPILALRKSIRKIVQINQGTVRIQKGSFLCERLFLLYSLNCQASGAVESLFTELDRTEGKSNQQALAGASRTSLPESPVPPAGAGWTQARARSHPEQQPQCTMSLATEVRLPVTPPSILC